MSEPKNADSRKIPATLSTEREETAWKSLLTQTIAGLLVFETLTGLLIWLIPFSLSAQFMVLTHTGAGIVFLVVWPWYQTKHWISVSSLPFTHLKVTGYGIFALTLGCVVTGVLLTWQGMFGNRISYLADALHIATGLACFTLGAFHVGSVIARDRRRSVAKGATVLRLARKRFYLVTSAIVIACAAATAAWQVIYSAPDLSFQFPDKYTMSYGEGRPFAPSMATTSTGGALHPRTLSGSASCGTAGCHQEIYEEWLPSAHRWASCDVAFQAVQAVMAENEGPDSTRYCAGCHDPIALFSGSKNIYDADLSSPGADEGVSCIACHRLISTDEKGNASYVIAAPDFYAYEIANGPAAKFLSDFLIRTYPKKHTQQFSPALLKSPEYCGACHKQFIDEEINDFGWVQLQNQYDNWRKSHWNREGDASKKKFCSDCHERKGIAAPEDEETKRCTAVSVSCRECHMRLVPSSDPAAGDPTELSRNADDGKHRHHGFIGANQFMPLLLEKPLGLKNVARHIQLTEEWLRGDTVLPEISHKWPAITKEYEQSSSARPTPVHTATGPVVPIKIRTFKKSAKKGEELAYAVEIHSRKVGHDFPTGPLDIIQCWVETEVRDATGNLLYESGKLKDGFVKEGSFIFKAEGVDAQGQLIDRHNLWELVGARFKRALFPGYTDSAQFKFQCPSESERKNKLPGNETHKFTASNEIKGPLKITARLLYRKINQKLLNIVTGSTKARAPITVMSTAEAEIPLQ